MVVPCSPCFTLLPLRINGSSITTRCHGRSSHASGVTGSLAVYEDDKSVGCPGVRPVLFQSGKHSEGVGHVIDKLGRTYPSSSVPSNSIRSLGTKFYLQCSSHCCNVPHCQVHLQLAAFAAHHPVAEQPRQPTRAAGRKHRNHGE